MIIRAFGLIRPFALALCLTPLMLLGGQAVASEKGATAQATEVQNRRVCKRVRQTGSRVKTRVCRTERDWQRIRDESRETLEKARESVGVTGGGGDN